MLEALCIVVCFIIILKLVNMLKRERDEASQTILAMNLGLFLLIGLGGILGIIAKTFGLWGNHW